MVYCSCPNLYYFVLKKSCQKYSLFDVSLSNFKKYHPPNSLFDMSWLYLINLQVYVDFNILSNQQSRMTYHIIRDIYNNSKCLVQVFSGEKNISRYAISTCCYHLQQEKWHKRWKAWLEKKVIYKFVMICLK